MYLLLAAIVLLVLFVASYGGPEMWVALASSTLSVLLVAGCAFIANAQSAGPYLNALAAQSPGLLQGGIRDLAFTAERTIAARGRTPPPPMRISIAPAPVPPTPVAPAPVEPKPDSATETSSEWLDLSWLDPVGWLSTAASWVNPWQSSETQQSEAPDAVPPTASVVRTEDPAPPEPPGEAQETPPAQQAPQPQKTPLPTVRAMMQPKEQEAKQQAAAAPSYRIVAVPSPQGAPVTASLPASTTTQVKWLEGVSPPPGVEGVLLSGTNGSSVPLEDIQATMRPDTDTTSLGTGNIKLNLRVEGPDGTVTPGAAIPPGARFHLQAEDLTNEDAEKLGGAFVSFAYSQDGRRRTSIMYLNQSALGGDGDIRPR
ncbi:MAG: hypothetical protein QNJ62_08770 [Methyloceanibacter sp.]|nr:hypothetical protein [Methyloceanibacter sp.]